MFTAQFHSSEFAADNDLSLDELNKYECVDYEDFRTHYSLHCVTI